jgi:glycosyltransferase involved in cell wall biosynthesis
MFGGRETLTRFERFALAVSPYLELRDLRAFKRAGKVIAVTYQGDEARQGDFCRAHFDISIARVVAPGYYSPWSDARKRERIAKFARFADLIYALNPDLLHVLPRHARFLPYANVDPAEWNYVEPRPDLRHAPIIVHAPSHRGVKGTEHLLAALDRLKREGVRYELRLVEGMRNDEARSVYEHADLVVDQLLAGWYGGLAVEAMALGKPVVAYLRETDLRFLPDEMKRALPVVNAMPDTVHAVLRDLLTSRRGELAELGRRGRAYVERWHDPRRIAAGLIQDYRTALAAKETS